MNPSLSESWLKTVIFCLSGTEVGVFAVFGNAIYVRCLRTRDILISVFAHGGQIWFRVSSHVETGSSWFARRPQVAFYPCGSTSRSISPGPVVGFRSDGRQGLEFWSGTTVDAEWECLQ